MPAVESDRRRGDLALLLALQRLLHDRSELWEPERPRRHVWGVHSGLGQRHGRLGLRSDAGIIFRHNMLLRHTAA